MRTQIGEWTVGIATSKNRPRYSAGWNAFTKDNKLKYNKSYKFTLLSDEDDGVIFHVEEQ